MFVELESSEQAEVVEKFLKDHGIKYVSANEQAQRVKRAELQKQIDEITNRYEKQFLMYAKEKPAYLKCYWNQEKYVVGVYNESHRRMTLKENGQLQTYLAVVRNMFKRFRSELQSIGYLEFEVKMEVCAG